MKKMIVILCLIIGAAASVTGCSRQEPKWGLNPYCADTVMVSSPDGSQSSYLAAHQIRQLYGMFEKLEFEKSETGEKMDSMNYLLTFYVDGQKRGGIIIVDDSTVIYNDCCYKTKQKIDIELMKRLSRR